MNRQSALAPMYEAAAMIETQRPRQVERGARLTLSAESMPLSEFAHWVSRVAEVSVVVDANIDDRPVTVNIHNEPVATALGAVARRAGVQLGRSGSLFYLGSLRPEDRGVLVRRVVRLSADQITNAVTTLLSQHGRVTVADDGLVMVGDRVEVLERVHDLLDQVERAPLGAWVVQLYVMSVSEREEWALGVDAVPSFELAQRFGQASSSSASHVRGALQATLIAARESEGVRMVAAPLLVVGDGQTGRLSDSTVVPVAKRTVSDEGTVTTTGFDYIPVGLIVSADVRDAGKAGILALDLEMSQLGGQIDGEAPIRLERAIATTAPLVSGGVYLVASWQVEDDRQGWAGQLGTVREVDRRRSSVQAWAVLSRIDGPLADAAGHVAPSERGTDEN